MSIDLSTENVFPLTEAPEHIPSHPSLASVRRWCSNGVKGVKLETIVIGGKRFTSAESIQRFCDRRTAVAEGETPPVQTSKARERAIEQAERELEREGI